MNRGVTEAAEELVNFAWSAVVTDCTESADYLNQLVDNLRAALAAEPGAAEGKPVAWLRPRDIARLAATDPGAINVQIANVNFERWTIPVYAAPHQSGESGK